jgi:hypothetical protein
MVVGGDGDRRTVTSLSPFSKGGGSTAQCSGGLKDGLDEEGSEGLLEEFPCFSPGDQVEGVTLPEMGSPGGGV